MSKKVMEMVIFQTRPETDEEQFLKTYEALNEVLKRDIEGFVSRTIMKDKKQDKWVEMIWWTSMETALAALENLPQTAEFGQYCSGISEDGMRMFHLEELA